MKKGWIGVIAAVFVLMLVLSVSAFASGGIEIEQHPTDITAAIGQKGTATVVASSDSEISYQWYFKKAAGTSWSKSSMTGSKTATITVPVTKARLGQQYKCVITTTDGDRAESAVVTVALALPTTITIDEQPEDIFAAKGTSGTATVAASSDTGAALSYQWYFKKAAGTSWSKSGMTGSKTATITVPVTMARIGQQYKCVIKSADGTTVETNVISVCEKPDIDLTITRSPDSYRVFAGEPVQLDVAVSVDENTYPVKYQWYKNDEMIEGATSNHLYFVPVTLADDGEYYCVVSGYGYAQTSVTATVEVFE